MTHKYTIDDVKKWAYWGDFLVNAQASLKVINEVYEEGKRDGCAEYNIYKEENNKLRLIINKYIDSTNLTPTDLGFDYDKKIYLLYYDV